MNEPDLIGRVMLTVLRISNKCLIYTPKKKANIACYAFLNYVRTTASAPTKYFPKDTDTMTRIALTVSQNELAFLGG
jgi:hypothetical protein